MVPGQLPEPLARTAVNFGWQWHAFTEQHEQFGDEFREWLYPVTPDDLRGKRVLDAGCGKGRHVFLAADFGAEHIVGLDLSSAVDVARRQTSHLAMADIVQGDLLTPPLVEGTFDLVYSIGVVHHVPDPGKAIEVLARCVRPGGVLHVWVYGYEGNALVRRLVDPVRRILARYVPPGTVRAWTLPPAVVLTALARLLRRIGPVPLLPYQAYLRRLGGYSVHHIWTIIYDQLMAPTTHYVKCGDLEGWFRSAGLTNVRIRNSRGMSWTATGQRP
jgi:SAM-dependent methyltransferase